MSGQLFVEGVFAVSFVDGVMVVGLVAGDVSEGSSVDLEGPDGVRISGRVGALHIHRVSSDPPERVRLSIDGPLASVIREGDVVLVDADNENDKDHMTGGGEHINELSGKERTEERIGNERSEYEKDAVDD